MMSQIKVPVLPIYNVVFFPHTAVPLQLTNPLAIKMVKECVKENSPLALSLTPNAYPGSVSPVEKICGMGMPIILEEKTKYIKVLVTGIGKIMLDKMVQNLPYPIYMAEIIQDRQETSVFQEAKVERLKNILTNWLVGAVSDSVERDNFVTGLKTVQHIVDYTCMFLIHDTELRQLLLETNSLYERIQILNLLLQGNKPYSENGHTANIIKKYESLEETAEVVH